MRPICACKQHKTSLLGDGGKKMGAGFPSVFGSQDKALLRRQVEGQDPVRFFPAHPLTCCLFWARFSSLSVPQFRHL